MTRKYIIEAAKSIESIRAEYAVLHMEQNKAYRYACLKNEDPALLDIFKKRYQEYRKNWREIPERAFKNKTPVIETPPQCVDIELASVCDLACPFCYRQHTVTPDGLLAKDLFFRIIDQCAEMKVPSIKLNWRGESLLHPDLPVCIDYAKQKGILEVLLNTNAVTLTEEKAKAIIEAGLDVIIYSFDGGTKETYERMRPGRFKPNHFGKVYDHIRQFKEIRDAMKSPFPRIKIQMILTKETIQEKEKFASLLGSCVDDLAFKAYSERGGEFSEIPDKHQEKLKQYFGESTKQAKFWLDKDDRLFVSAGRLPCEQIYQRLMITYDGLVCMCCYDWGNRAPLGYIDERAIHDSQRAYEEAKRRIDQKNKGYESMTGATMPKRFYEPTKKIQSLKEIWSGESLTQIREMHLSDRMDKIELCRSCEFKDTYLWKEI